jgi:hypothetical protein
MTAGCDALSVLEQGEAAAPCAYAGGAFAIVRIPTIAENGNHYMNGKQERPAGAVRMATGEMNTIELERELFDAAAERAAEQGLSVDAYVSLLLRRSLERAPDEASVLAYDHVDDGGAAVLDREAGETDADYERRSALYGGLFGRG